MWPMVMWAQDRDLQANEIPSKENIVNKLSFPGIPPCKSYLILGPPWEVEHGFYSSTFHHGNIWFRATDSILSFYKALSGA